MRQSFKTLLETRRIRLQRHSGAISRDVLTGVVLTGAVGAIAVVMAFVYFLVLGSPYFRMEKTVISGCARVSEKDILALSGITPGQSLLTVNKEKIIRKIKSNPWIENVAVRSELPGKLLIEIRERRPVALMRKDRMLYYVDGNALAFKKLEDNEIAELPILTGFCENGIDNTELIRKSLDLLNFLAKHEGFPRLDHVSEVFGDETFGFSIFADNGIRIRLGFGGYEDKLKRLRPIMVDLARKNMDGFFYVDLNNPAKVTVHRKDVPHFPKFSKGYST